MKSLHVAAVLLVLSAAGWLAGCKKEGTSVERATQAQVLFRGCGAEVANLDPHLCTDTNQRDILSALLEGLVTEDPVDLHPVPGVASRWKIEDDGLTYRFHLRPDAKWSNGKPVTSADFAVSFQRALTPGLAAENAGLLYVLRNAEAYHHGSLQEFSQVGVETPAPDELVLRLEHPTPAFLSMLTHVTFYPVYAPAIETLGPLASRSTAWSTPEHFVGNGAFALKAWKYGQEIVVTKSASYWDAATVQLKEIHFVFTPDRDSEERAFRAGQLHLTEALPPGRIAAWKRDHPEKLRSDAYLGTEFYRVNLSRPFVGDARVRRALALALDREKLVETVLRGGQPPAGSLVPYELGHYAPDNAFRYAPEEARRLLAEAGYGGGKGAPIIEILFNTSETHKVMAETVQQMWKKELGLQVRLVNQERTVTLAARRSGDFQVLRSVWIGDYLDPLSFLEIMATGNGNNFTGWGRNAYDDRLFRAARTADLGARTLLLKQAEELMLGDAPIIPLYHYTHVFLIEPSVKNWHPTLLDHHPYKNVYLE